MSWSFQGIGKPESFPKALDEHGEKLTGDSKAEFEAVKPHLTALIGMNANANCLSLSASGSVSKKDGVVTYSSCNVELKQLGRLLS